MFVETDEDRCGSSVKLKLVVVGKFFRGCNHSQLPVYLGRSSVTDSSYELTVVNVGVCCP